jgi:hypothetical protein
MGRRDANGFRLPELSAREQLATLSNGWTRLAEENKRLRDELQAAYDQATAQFKVGDIYATFNRQEVNAWGTALSKMK